MSDTPNPPPVDNSNSQANDLNSTNLFLRLADKDDAQPAGSYIAQLSDNSTAYVLHNSPPIKNAECRGILVDSGSAFSSSGNETEYYLYCRLTGTTPSIDESKARTIRYGIGREISKGTACINFPMGNMWLSFEIHIITADIPIILGIQDMDRLGLYFNNLSNNVIHPASGFSIPTVRFR